MKLIISLLLILISYSIVSNFLLGGLTSFANYSSYKLAFAKASDTSQSSENKVTGSGGDNKDSVLKKETSKDQIEHSSISDQNKRNSTDIGKLQVKVNVDQPVHGGEKQKIEVTVTNSSLDPIKGAKVTGSVKILSHKMELSDKTSKSGKIQFPIEIGAQSEPSVAKILLKTSSKGYDSRSSKLFFNILPDKSEQKGNDNQKEVSSTNVDTKHGTKHDTNGILQELKTNRNEKSISFSTNSLSEENSNKDSCEESGGEKSNDNQEQCDPRGLSSDVRIESVKDVNGKKLRDNETTIADNLEFTFSDRDNSSIKTFDCSLDGKATEECMSPYVIGNISFGAHKFKVRGIEDDQDPSYDTYSWITTTELYPLLTFDTTKLGVTSTDPIANATEVPLSKVITAKFNETVQDSTVNPSTFILKTGSTTVPGDVSLSSDGKVASFKPSDPLASFTSYEANVTKGMKGTNDDTLEGDKVWSFSTVDTSAPETVINSSIDGNGDDLKDGKTTDSDTMSFIFSSNKVNSTFECSLDSSSFKKCDDQFTASSSGFQSYSNLKDGKHKFEVVATSGAGVKDPSPAKFSWTVKTEKVTSSNFNIGNIKVPSIPPFNFTNGTAQISPGNNNVTVQVPGYGNVSLEFSNLTQAGSVTVQALLFTPELEKTGIQSDPETGLKRISMEDGQLFTLVGTVFNITSVDAIFTGPIKISIPYNDTLVSQVSSKTPVDPASQIRFLHYNDTAWNDETSSVNVASTHVIGSTNSLGLVVSAVRPSATP